MDGSGSGLNLEDCDDWLYGGSTTTAKKTPSLSGAKAIG